jgi:hypothetical protein
VIDFTNKSSATCTMYGYPGLSITSSSQAQIGAAATRDVVRAPTTVTLAPGATANTTFGLIDSTLYPTSQCKPETSAYLTIYPPNTTQSMEVAYTGATACANSSLKLLTVEAVAAGNG